MGQQQNNRAVGVLAVLDAEIEAAMAACRSAHGSPRLTALVEARTAVAELIEASKAIAASTFEDARQNEDERRAAMRSKSPVYPPAELLWCRVDALNPCWFPGRPTVTPVRHWGWTPYMDGDGLACEHCRLRAALARVRGDA